MISTGHRYDASKMLFAHSIEGQAMDYRLCKITWIPVKYGYYCHSTTLSSLFHMPAARPVQLANVLYCGIATINVH